MNSLKELNHLKKIVKFMKMKTVKSKIWVIKLLNS